MISIAYCDDERAALNLYPEQVRAAFQHYRRSVEIERFQRPGLLMERIAANNRFDLLFLDISMPDMNGIELGRQLRKLADDVLIVFVSSHEELVFESFQVTPFRFIRKGHFYQDLEEGIPAIIAELEKRQTELQIDNGKEVYRIAPYKILYIESSDKIQKLFTLQGTVEIRYKLKELETLLAEYGFIRVHKGYLVNARFIACVNKREVVLNTGESIPLSKYRLEQVMEELERVI
ncbi:LytR/AlgR family response regulator transcription factor [Anaeromassilibacillus senegalensis]|uniref:LytR/AlgR family response regulator transcription factor n=1 Tax=Anaeromassilibacillus senegalensis TaxID=1673717 RepID=UPI000682CA25|nr:LytTR family DNA-binding domain-containing protein [Anaeromassilibacillus senegalensis]